MLVLIRARFYFITNDEDSAAHQGKELEIGFEAALGEDSSMGIDLSA